MKKKQPGRGLIEAMLIASILAFPVLGWAGENPIPVEGSPSTGPDDALVTIVEFSDFQCPFCARGAKTIDEVKKKYPREVRVVFKHFPLGFHKQADEAARASMAAHRQGKFWIYHDKLFAHAKKFRSLDEAGGLDDHFSELAGFVGMEPAQFLTDYRDPAINGLVQRDMKLGTKIGVRGTPHFFINGARVSGAQPLSKFEEIIDVELANARAAIAAKEATRANIYEVMTIKNYRAAEPSARKKKPRPGVSDVQMISIEEGDATYGAAEKALVTIVEFSDFQCPFCARGAKTIDEIKEAYGDDVRVVFKHLPLPFHEQAEDAAVAALAAGRQGKFWVYHDLLFENRQRFKEPEIWLALANEAKLNVKKFEDDYNDPELREQVKRDLTLAGEVGARGTPNFFINGKKLTGAQPFAKFKGVIDEQIKLARKIKKEKKLSGDKLYAALVEENKKSVIEPVVDAKPADVLSAEQYKALRAYKGAPTMGSTKKAKVVIYEFTDLQCPYCRKADKTIAQIKKDYGSKVAVVTFQFPLAFHQQADEAARAVLAAKRQGKSWEMRAVIFEEQRALRDGNIDATLVGFAKALGLNVKAFEKDYNDPELQEQVDAEIRLGGQMGVRGTPNFFINDKRLVGAQPIEKFKEVIDAELTAKKK